MTRFAREAAKGGLRLYGMGTSFLRGSPDFLVIGTKRGGTTSLYRAMTEHPAVAQLFPRRQKIKGTYFFDNNYGRGVAWYRSHFPVRLGDGGGRHSVRSKVVVGEASPYYLPHPLAPSRAAQAVPAAKLVALVRDPVERAYSHYKEQVRRGWEELSFEEALDHEPERLAGEVERLQGDPGYYSFEHEHHAYTTQGLYADHLRRWLEGFPRDQMLVLLSEDFYRDPRAVLDRVFEFVGVPPTEVPVGRFNFHPAETMGTGTRRRLRELFAKPNQDLEALFGLDLSSWGG